jgi:hypothetical protein
MSTGKEELEEMKAFMRINAELLKPMFGMMFWQLQSLEETLDAEEFTKQGMTLTMIDAEDETLAAFMAHYMSIWQNSKDFNAASRFICSCLNMSADELLQTRQMYLQAK